MNKNYMLEIKINLGCSELLKKLTGIVDNAVQAKGLGLSEIFYIDEDIYLGKGEYITIIFDVLYSLGLEYELDCTFVGSGIYIRW